MSRSKKRNPFCKRIGESDKKDKRLANRKFRRLEKMSLSGADDPPSNIRAVSDTYDFKSDGLAHYVRSSDSFAVEFIQKLMRK